MTSHGLTPEELAVIGASAAAEADEAAPDEATEKRTQATVLAEMAQESFTFVLADNGLVYGLLVDEDAPNVAHPLKGHGHGTVSAWLRRRFFERAGKPPSAQAVTDALALLTAYAQDASAALPLRVARWTDPLGDPEPVLWYDLADPEGRAVRITPEGWDVEPRSPIAFRRSRLTGRQVVPERGGSLLELWEYLHVPEEDRPLILAALVSAFFPDVPRPILELFGEPGSAKSTLAKLLVHLTDPTPEGAELRTLPTSLDDWKTVAKASTVVALDNVNSLSETLLDALCRASTGDAILARTKYSDDDVHTVSFRRFVVLTTVALGSIRGDLADRIVPVELHPITDRERRPEAELVEGFRAALPRILGALLDVVASVLRKLPSVNVDRLPRMADFGRIAYAVSPDALERYIAERDKLAEQVVDSSTVGHYVRLLVDRLPSLEGKVGNLPTGTDPANGVAFDGPARDLLKALRQIAEREDDRRASRVLPSTAQALGRDLTNMRGDLARIGVQVATRKVRGTTHYRIST